MEGGERADLQQRHRECGWNGERGKSRSTTRTPGMGVKWRVGKEQICNKDAGSEGGMEGGKIADIQRGHQEMGVEWRAGKEQIFNEGGMEGGKRCGSGMSGEGAGLEGGA